MKFKFLAIIFFAFTCFSSFGQKLKDGTYTFSIRDFEYENAPIVAKCKVVIKGDSIKVIYTDSTLTLIKYGDVFDEGILIKHRKTKQWIIAHSMKDMNAKEVGACSGGPMVIDLKKKEIWYC
ncbi:calycin-like domain-containing protein [Ferruginibacter albus]|uniref:calycin-like domain-containing protein n=1 Tax=Ferruginibacter albus TaxID=2875540 RepID=UPI001CC453EB|nr:calycin-like domain-containing protein [Ferruginibacter albus]UAY50938.1 calycin-like domain-containing protein [Ferruginibacter albus]